jgi:hypothetical protein
VTVLNILVEKWQLVFSLFSAFVVGLVIGQIIYTWDKDRAFRLVDWLDARRKPFVKMLYNLLHQSHGVMKAIAFIFAVNLLVASLLHHTVGGLLLAPPFFLLLTGGLLVSLLVRKYPERLLMTSVVAPFEFGAFIVAATGGVNMGMSLWGHGETALAFRQWATLFFELVVPLQFFNALWEGLFAFHSKSWPQYLYDDTGTSDKSTL